MVNIVRVRCKHGRHTSRFLSLQTIGVQGRWRGNNVVPRRLAYSSRLAKPAVRRTEARPGKQRPVKRLVIRLVCHSSAIATADGGSVLRYSLRNFVSNQRQVSPKLSRVAILLTDSA